MSNAILICFRENRVDHYPPAVLERISGAISTDHVTPTVETINREGLQLCIIDRTRYSLVKDASVCLGFLLDGQDAWHVIGSGIPDGAFAILRSNTDSIELVTDSLGQRTIWYALTESLFVASTSQRAIIMLLGGFHRNAKVDSWMLATGTLGPYQSWDERVKMVTPNTIQSLDRKSWRLSVSRNALPFKPRPGTMHEYEPRLTEALASTFSRLSLDNSKLILALSGGYDSRAILIMLPNRSNLQAFTIATPHRSKYGTYSITSRLAERYDIKHRFLDRQNSTEPVRVVLNRFLIASEGRTDGLSGYQDGFSMWRSLREEGFQAVLWGDEVFGWKEFRTFEEVKQRLGISMLSEYDNLPDLAELEVEDITWPLDYLPRPSESPCCWFGRIYQDFRVSHTLSARVDCKNRYLDVLNPLMARKLVLLSRELPDELRHYKRVVAKVVTDMCKDIPYHSSVSHGCRYAPPKTQHQDILTTEAGVRTIMEELDSQYSRNLLSQGLINFLLSKTAICDTHSNVVKTVKSHLAPFVPQSVRRLSRRLNNRQTSPSMNLNHLAFRAYIIARMSRMLEDDGKLLSHKSEG